MKIEISFWLTVNMDRRPIKLFLFLHKLYRDIGIYSPQPNQIRCSFNRQNVILLCFGQSILSIAAFLLFEANSVLDFGMALFYLAASCVGLAMYLISIRQRENIPEFIENCDTFIETRPQATIAYQGFNENSEKFCKWFCIFVFANVSICSCSIFIFSIANYYIFDMAERSFFLMNMTVWFPFDWRTPFGYVVAWISQTLAWYTICVAVVGVLSWIFASSWLFVTIVDDDLKQELAAFNNDVRTSHGNDHPDLMRRFCDIVQLYSDAKGLVNQFNGIHRFLIFSFLSFGICGVCNILLTLQFQLADDNSKLIEIFVSSVMVFWTYLIILLNCEPGERISQAFERFYDELEQCDWHLLPTDLRRLYLIFLLDAQQPVNFQCYGRILCTRETFKKITNTGYSYFATIRGFEHT